VFSGIVLNTTKPYQVDDLVVIDGVEGKVLDIDWRATHLLTSAGTTGRGAELGGGQGEDRQPQSPEQPARGVDQHQGAEPHSPASSARRLDRTLQGSSSLLLNPPPKAVLKEAGEEMSEYVASGFIAELARKAKCAINCSTSPIGISKRQVFPGISMG
jgi:hypothetical protein